MGCAQTGVQNEAGKHHEYVIKNGLLFLLPLKKQSSSRVIFILLLWCFGIKCDYTFRLHDTPVDSPKELGIIRFASLLNL